MPSAVASQTLPTELVNLLALHTSFLTALSLHYAHNGTAIPVDLRDLTSSISAVWQKRAVTFNDIRLCVGVLGAGPSGNNNPFYLSDYGRGKICLEIQHEHRMSGAMGTMNEDAMQAMFMSSLEYLWKQWGASQGSHQKLSARPIATPKRRGRPKKTSATQPSIQLYVDDTTIPKFIAQLPHAEITTSPSIAATAPLQEKGRKRLREFKDSQHTRTPKKSRATTGKENEPAHPNTPLEPQPAAQPKITHFTSVRKSNLLDRILAKQDAAKALPNPPSPAEQQRLAALQRSEEVLGVLALLASSKGPGSRVSFSMATLLQSLRGSIRTPISKEEAAKCVEVLAGEVAPGYVSVLRMGAIESVVINLGMKPVNVRGRLAALGAV
ncbi:hypothetical protein EJ04DRAFT_549609 [Polyplosphaeria fusca]|uniref:DNA replication factor Cdt1 C-terminal domain-containing protein n=1 Tax=Polyplosphaeria fusca TaxID=682080 RepID=A0A9P4R3H8_9PLEO|nr:hypothetical protein EJ04DRAFT_549609 [Polyplosphaeria fusca]